MLWGEWKRRCHNRFVGLLLASVILLTFGIHRISFSGDRLFKKVVVHEKKANGPILERDLLNTIHHFQKGEEIPEDSFRINVIYRMVSLYSNIDVEGIVDLQNTPVKKMPEHMGGDFYNLWEKKGEAIIEKTLPLEQQKIVRKEMKEIRIPFQQYSGAYDWSYSISAMQYVYFYIILLSGLFGAGTFSESVEDESLELLLATKGGRKSIKQRFLIPIFFGVLLFLFAIGTQISFMNIHFGLEGLKSSQQLHHMFTPGNSTLGEIMIKTWIGVLLGVLVSATLGSLLSIYFKKTNSSMGAIVLLFILGIQILLFSKIPDWISYGLLGWLPLHGGHWDVTLSTLYRLDGNKLVFWTGVEQGIACIISIFGYIYWAGKREFD